MSRLNVETWVDVREFGTAAHHHELSLSRGVCRQPKEKLLILPLPNCRLHAVLASRTSAVRNAIDASCHDVYGLIDENAAELLLLRFR